MDSPGLKAVLITGAEGALGTTVVTRFSSAGVRRIFATYFSEHPRNEKVEWIKTDLTRSTSVKSAIGPIAAEVEALVHCAGGFRFAKVEDTRDEDLDFLLGANLCSAFYLLRELIPPMKQRDFGRIVLVSSRATLQASAGMGAYAASKAGLNMLVQSAADEFRKFNININAVMPTVIDTPANRRSMPDADFSTWVAPTDLAEIIFSLTQPWGKPIHGALIPVAGRL